MKNGVIRKTRRLLLCTAVSVALITLTTGLLRSEAAGGEQDGAMGQGVEIASDMAVSAFAMVSEEETVFNSKMEIVNDVLLCDVPAADYSYSFNGRLENAVAVSRSGDVDGGFNNGTYPEADSSVMPLFAEGIEGRALYLDGSYGVELVDIDELADSYTISFWFKAEEMCDWSPFLVIGSNLLDADVTQNYICFNKKTTEEGESVVPIFNTINAVLGNSCEIRPSLEDKRCIDLKEWNYITIAVNGSENLGEDGSKVMGYLYLNGELIGGTEVSRMSLEKGNVKAYLGINCFDKLFRAYYDEIHIWNSTLNENQINDMYNAYLGEEIS